MIYSSSATRWAPTSIVIPIGNYENKNIYILSVQGVAPPKPLVWVTPAVFSFKAILVSPGANRPGIFVYPAAMLMGSKALRAEGNPYDHPQP